MKRVESAGKTKLLPIWLTAQLGLKMAAGPGLPNSTTLTANTFQGSVRSTTQRTRTGSLLFTPGWRHSRLAAVAQFNLGPKQPHPGPQDTCGTQPAASMTRGNHPRHSLPILYKNCTTLIIAGTERAEETQECHWKDVETVGARPRVCSP